MPNASPRPEYLSPTQAAHVAARARRALRAGCITHHAYAVLDALLWSARRPGAASASAAYSRIEDLAHVARATVAGAIEQLVAAGLVQRIKRRALVVWHNGGRAWRQLVNEYRFLHCEFTAQPESQTQAIRITRIEPSGPEIAAAQAALAERRRVIEARLLRNRSGRPVPAS